MDALKLGYFVPGAHHECRCRSLNGGETPNVMNLCHCSTKEAFEFWLRSDDADVNA